VQRRPHSLVSSAVASSSAPPSRIPRPLIHPCATDGAPEARLTRYCRVQTQRPKVQANTALQSRTPLLHLTPRPQAMTPRISGYINDRPSRVLEAHTRYVRVDSCRNALVARPFPPPRARAKMTVRSHGPACPPAIAEAVIIEHGRSVFSNDSPIR
jgi:hypothetical protein